MTIKELRDIAAKRNFIIPAADESDYLTLLRAADLAVKHVDALPPYVDPRLVPKDVVTAEDLPKTRLYTKLSAEENPLNAWSHKVRADVGSVRRNFVLMMHSLTLSFQR